MSRKHIVCLAILGILIMALSMFGCQGYEAPKYKSPDDSGDAANPEEVNIDVSDIGNETPAEEDNWWSDSETTGGDEGNVPVVEPTATVKSYKPKAYEPAVVDEGAAAEGDDFAKSPYRQVVEDDLPTLTVTEGDLVKLNVKATDADGDTLQYTFTAPLNSEGKWQTRAGDEGAYYPEVTVSDGKTEVVKTVKIVVEPKNNKPVLQFIPNIEVNEGDTVSLRPTATDADGDKLTYSYSGWMTESSKVTGYNDQGEHVVVVSVTDGISTVSQEVTVNVKDVNRAPEVEIEF
jgi:hypothetical protein